METRNSDTLVRRIEPPSCVQNSCLLTKCPVYPIRVRDAIVSQITDDTVVHPSHVRRPTCPGVHVLALVAGPQRAPDRPQPGNGPLARLVGHRWRAGWSKGPHGAAIMV